MHDHDATIYLLSSDVARILGLTPCAVRVAWQRGQLRSAAVTERGVRLFVRADVDAFVAARAVKRKKLSEDRAARRNTGSGAAA